MSRSTTIPGLAPKPDFCYDHCPRAFSQGVGFVPDFIGSNPKIGILLDKPTKDEATNRQAFTSGYSRFFFSTVGKELGISKENLIVSHVLRCASFEYPTGKMKVDAERVCRSWDNKSVGPGGLPTISGGLIKWDPNLFIITFGLDDCLEMSRSEKAKSDAFHACMINDFAKALRFAGSGFRPMVLMGKEPMHLFPFTRKWQGGVKAWRGHWWEGNWPFTPMVSKASYNKNVVTEYDEVGAKTPLVQIEENKQMGFEF